MSSAKLPKGAVDKSIIAALDATDLIWWVHSGKKHWKFYLAGRLVFVAAHGNSKREYQRNMAAKTVKAIREMARAIKEGEA